MNQTSLNFRKPSAEDASEQATFRLDRMQTKFRRGRPVVMQAADLAAPAVMLVEVETLSAARLRPLRVSRFWLLVAPDCHRERHDQKINQNSSRSVVGTPSNQAIMYLPIFNSSQVLSACTQAQTLKTL